jgi:hypothetical protein
MIVIFREKRALCGALLIAIHVGAASAQQTGDVKQNEPVDASAAASAPQNGSIPPDARVPAPPDTPAASADRGIPPTRPWPRWPSHD